MPDSQRELIEAAQRREPSAMDELIRGHMNGLRVFVRLRVDATLRAKESCSDLVQSACREAFEHIDQFEYRGENSFRNWLYTTALNKIRQRHEYYVADKRDTAREHQTPSGVHWSRILPAQGATEASPSQVAVAEETVARVEVAFAEMPESYREILTLSRVLGLSHEEIAQQTNRSPGAVRTQLSRALVKLSEILARSGS